MKNIATLAACCLLIGVAGGMLHAQVEDPAGPLKFSVLLKVATTDNRDALPTEESNTDFLVSPRIDAVFTTGRSLLDFYYVPTLRYRTDPSPTQNDEEFFHELGLLLRHDVTPRLSVQLEEDFSYTDDPSVEAAGGTLRRDSSFMINRVRGLLAYDMDRQSRFELDAIHRVKTYEEDELDFLDEDSASVGGRIARQVSRTVAVSAEARAEDFNYEDNVVTTSIATSGSLDRSFTSASAGVGIENEFQANCRASLRVGYKQLEYDDDQIDSEGAPYAIAMLQVAAVPSMRFTASARHELRDSDVFPFASQTYSDVAVGVEMDATPRVTFDLSGAYRLSEYDEDSLPAGRRAQIQAVNEFLGARGSAITSVDGDETSVLVKGGVTFKASDNTQIKLSHQYEDEDSDVSVSFTRNETSLSLLRRF